MRKDELKKVIREMAGEVCEELPTGFGKMKKAQLEEVYEVLLKKDASTKEAIRVLQLQEGLEDALAESLPDYPSSLLMRLADGLETNPGGRLREVSELGVRVRFLCGHEQDFSWGYLQRKKMTCSACVGLRKGRPLSIQERIGRLSSRGFHLHFPKEMKKKDRKLVLRTQMALEGFQEAVKKKKMWSAHGALIRAEQLAMEARKAGLEVRILPSHNNEGEEEE